MLDLYSEPALTAFFGLVGGIILGLAARIGRFCTLGAIEDLYYGGSSLRLRMWGIAIGVAVIGTFGLSALGIVTLDHTLYLNRVWNPVASIFGGLMFGYGMALSGNCGYGALARLGGGDLRSFVIVLVMGIFAYITLGGPLAPLRLYLFGDTIPSEATYSFAYLFSSISSVPVNLVGMILGALILIATLSDREILSSKTTLFWSVLIGLAIVSGWAGTSWLATNGFDDLPVVSHTFSAPIGETILYSMTSSGNSLSFGTGSVIGVLLGAFIGSLFKGHFRWEACDDPRELRRQIFGAALMGTGAVISIGCSVGQGLSAFSVLSFSAPVTFIAILLGAWVGLKQLIVGLSG
ncbi:YeeE/YedE family protein [Rhodobacterales bacterium HTCC2150]|nr:YeeE/YedE family protein [Rhodobacterales bacterium HTCC2150] [Rhodobacteraceae bacterium HTCC2150]